MKPNLALDAIIALAVAALIAAMLMAGGCVKNEAGAFKDMLAVTVIVASNEVAIAISD